MTGETLRALCMNYVNTATGCVQVQGIHSSITGGHVNIFYQAQNLSASEARILGAVLIATADEVDKVERKA